MEVKDCKKAYFLGIGGIGMSSIAQYLHHQGVEVYGYDAMKTPLCEKLEAMGMHIHYQPNPDLIPDEIDMYIYTPAIPHDFIEWEKIRKMQKPILKRSECLASIVENYPTIAVAGTHGKTSVTAMIAHTLHKAKIPFLGFVGGIVKGYDSNFFFTPQAKWAVVEADEYDRSFLKLKPLLSIINAIEADHLDIYQHEDALFTAFSDFIHQTKTNGKVFISADVNTTKLFLSQPHTLYGIDKGQIRAKNISNQGYHMIFDVYINETLFLRQVNFPFPGLHQVKNCLAAIATLHSMDVDPQTIKNGLESFPGIKRRFDIIYQSKHLTYIDDYAHHPTEIKALIEALRLAFPHQTITGIFQPHLYSRTRDLAEDFATALDMLDLPIVTDIYPAREKPIPGITPHFLLNKLKHPQRQYIPFEKIPEKIANSKDVVVTIGAGNVDLLQPMILQKISEHEK